MRQRDFRRGAVLSLLRPPHRPRTAAPGYAPGPAQKQTFHYHSSLCPCAGCRGWYFCWRPAEADQQKQASDRAAYIASLNELRAQTIRGGSVAEKMCNLTKQVWYNTIYEERDSITDKYTRSGGVFHDDFNTSLSLLYAEDNTATVISGLQASRELVDGIMADLQNPPTEFAACYEAADSLYDAYCGLIDLAVSPSGSLKTYSENFSKYDEDLLKYYNKLEALIPSE